MSAKATIYCIRLISFIATLITTLCLTIPVLLVYTLAKLFYVLFAVVVLLIACILLWIYNRKQFLFFIGLNHIMEQEFYSLPQAWVEAYEDFSIKFELTVAE